MDTFINGTHTHTHTHTQIWGLGGVGDKAAYTQHDRNATEPQSSAEICWHFQVTLFYLNMLGDGYCVMNI